MKMTGVSGVISAAHYSRDGKLHGHTWQVIVWHYYANGDIVQDAESRKRALLEYLERFDHKRLPDELAWGEDLAKKIGFDLKADAVDLVRPLEGIYAKWCKQ